MSRELEFPPYPPVVTGSPSESTGKRSDVATFVTDLILKYDVKNILEQFSKMSPEQLKKLVMTLLCAPCPVLDLIPK